MHPKIARYVKLRNKKMNAMIMKFEICKKYEEGTRIVTLAREYGRNKPTISPIIKNKEAIKASKSSKGMIILASGRTSINDEMERLLLIWIEEKQIVDDTLKQSVISHKASAIFDDLVEAQRDGGDEGTSQQAPQVFKDSDGWFDHFRRTGIRSVIRHGEAASSDKKAADEFLRKFEELISGEAYIPQQFFNCEETGLFWKKMPHRTYITSEEKNLPGHIPMKDRLTLAFCANSSGDLKIKPLLVYHSENSRKAQNIMKDRLPVFRRSNGNAWVMRPILSG
ncbi:tigger transposable element-derived protein 1-like [Palaemon carinicauda]|uniref:tigger transposable element-derived protein 1-like n=1 Tax=Palaemon carinicauda TaxID=392227 RepID=UPI0035B61C9D